MTVRELMELLRGADPDATVRLMNHPKHCQSAAVNG